MSDQIDYNDPRYAQAAAEILRRHDGGEPEANITSAVRDFLIVTGLVRQPTQGPKRTLQPLLQSFKGLSEGQVISDNYFCRLTTTRIAGFA